MFADVPNYLKLAMLAALLVVVASLVFLVQRIVDGFNAPPPFSLIVVEAFNEGADAAATSKAVGSPVEQQLAGSANILYFYSTATNAGEYTLTVALKGPPSSKEPWQEVNQCVDAVKAELPPAAADSIHVSKDDNNILGVISGDMAAPDMSLLDQLATIEGISRIQLNSAASPAGQLASTYGFEPGTVNKVNGVPCSSIIIYQYDRSMGKKSARKIQDFLDEKNKVLTGQTPYKLHSAFDKTE